MFGFVPWPQTIRDCDDVVEEECRCLLIIQLSFKIPAPFRRTRVDFTRSDVWWKGWNHLFPPFFQAVPSFLSRKVDLKKNNKTKLIFILFYLPRQRHRALQSSLSTDLLDKVLIKTRRRSRVGWRTSSGVGVGAICCQTLVFQHFHSLR